MDQANVNFAVYEGGTEYLGLAEATLPNAERQTVDMTGAGIGGTFSAPVAGHYNAMSLTLNWRTPNKQQDKLMKHGPHTIELRQAIQSRNDTTGALETIAVKHVLVVYPKTLSTGKAAPASTTDTNMEFSVSYHAKFFNGEKVSEIDVFNMKSEINGVDELAAVRAALGK